MMEQTGRGRIINIESRAEKNPVPCNTAYSESKHGILGLTKSVASEVALTGYTGITINAICPFYVNTEMFSGSQGYAAEMGKMSGMLGEEIIEKAVSRNLQHRIIEPEEARGITGQALNIRGRVIFY
jgi:ketoreductase